MLGRTSRYKKVSGCEMRQKDQQRVLDHTSSANLAMKFLIVLSAVVAVALARPGYLAGGITTLGLGPLGLGPLGLGRAILAAPAPVALPAPPQDTPEVQAARAEHLAAVAKAAAAPAPAPAPAEAPQPVQDTPEVASAKAAHAVAHAHAATVAAIAPAGILAAPGLLGVPAAYAAPGIITAAPAAYITSHHIPILTAQGVPLDTPEVQAARAADAIAHINAKAALLG